MEPLDPLRWLESTDVPPGLCVWDTPALRSTPQGQRCFPSGQKRVAPGGDRDAAWAVHDLQFSVFCLHMESVRL